MDRTTKSTDASRPGYASTTELCSAGHFVISAMLLHAFLLVVAASSIGVFGYKSFVSRVPNGDSVPHVAALGHENASGGGSRNVFGTAFQATGFQWTPALCHADSDGDGATNGQELGDPCCTWTVGSKGKPPSANFEPTPPGQPNAFSPNQLQALQCATSSNATAHNPTTETTTAKPATAAVTTAAWTPAVSSRGSSRAPLATAMLVLATVVGALNP
ncbi:unnamed protein product [Aphanomyces euteiches]